MFWGRVEAENKNKKLGREDVVLVHPQNGFNSLILNWCIGGCWFTPAVLTMVGVWVLGPPSPQSRSTHSFLKKMFHTIATPTSISTYLPILVFVGTDTSNPPTLNFLDHDPQLLIKLTLYH
jgi:hypothetical protein